MFTSIAGLKGISIEVAESSNGIVSSDKQMLNTILRNLITNAIKFSHSDSKITLKSTAENNMVKFSVQDSGTGIEPEYIDRLFNIESAFSTTGTGNEKGSGLGLILCKEFVEKSGGSIWLESTLGIGTTFYFTIPAASAALNISST